MHHPIAFRRAPMLVCAALLVAAAIALAACRARRPRTRRRARHRLTLDRQRRRLLHLRRGRPLGGQHERKLVLGRRARLDRLRRQRGRQRGTDRPLPPLEVGRGLHRRRRQRREPRLLGRQDLQLQRRRKVEAGPRLLQLRRQRRPGADAAELRERPRREARRRLDRRQQLQLRLGRADLRRRLPGVHLVLRLLLQQRKLGDEQLHGELPVESQRRSRNRSQERRAGDDATPATAPRSTRCSCRTTRRRSRSARASATPRAGTRGRRQAGAASGTPTRTTRTKKCCRRSTARFSAPRTRWGSATSRTLELSSAFNGRRLCEKGVGLLEEEGLRSWTQAGAVDKTEWVNEIRTVSTIFGPYEIQEDIHPNYWGQLALRNCLTQAYNAGTPKGGTCTISAIGPELSGRAEHVSALIGQRGRRGGQSARPGAEPGAAARRARVEPGAAARAGAARERGGRAPGRAPALAPGAGDARGRAGHAARAVLRPRLRARADAVHDADRPRTAAGKGCCRACWCWGCCGGPGSATRG